MLQLSRTVRFCLSDAPSPTADTPPRHNTYAAWPPMRGLGRYYELTVCCHGTADPQTGYFINIKHIDTAVRNHALPVLQAALHAPGTSAHNTPMGTLLHRLLAALQPPLNQTVDHVTLQLTPYLSLTARSDAMTAVTLRHQYEFSAAHRLHVPTLSDEENRATFGKCNNPAGHGHNYHVEVAVDVPIDAQGQIIAADTLDAAVDTYAIERLDHKHLNIDVPEFANLNPSVEHIVQVVFTMLTQPIADLGGSLREVTVWETGKTKCTFSGPVS